MGSNNFALMWDFEKRNLSEAVLWHHLLPGERFMTVAFFCPRKAYDLLTANRKQSTDGRLDNTDLYYMTRGKVIDIDISRFVTI